MPFSLSTVTIIEIFFHRHHLMTDINTFPHLLPGYAFPITIFYTARFAKICETVTNATLFDLVPYFISSHVASRIVKLSVTIKILTMLAPHSTKHFGMRCIWNNCDRGLSIFSPSPRRFNQHPLKLETRRPFFLSFIGRIT